MHLLLNTVRVLLHYNFCSYDVIVFKHNDVISVTKIVTQIRFYKKIIKMFKAESFCRSRFVLRSAKSGNYFTQYWRLELKAWSFSKSGTDIWNSLPLELRKKNKIRFKKDLKIQLLNMLTNVNDYIGVPEIITGFPPYH